VIFGLLAGYYATYAMGLLRWRRREDQSSVTSSNPAP